MREALRGAGRELTEPLRGEDYLVLAAALLLPWAFGGVELWAFRSAALLLAGAAAAALVRGGWPGLGLERRSLWLAPAGLLAAWALFQLVPLPPAAVRVLSPAADAVYRQSFPGYGSATPPGERAAALERLALSHVPEVADTPLPDRPATGFSLELGGRWHGWRPLSLFPSAGLERAMWYIALLLGFLVARERCRDPAVARCYSLALFADFVLLALFGLVHNATSNGKLYWIRAPLEDANPLGPYVNPNNFAAVMELAVPWLFGCAVLGWRREQSARPSELRAHVFAAAALVCLLAALASGSKSSGLLIFLGLLAVGLVAAPGLRSRIAVAAGAATVFVAAVVALRQSTVGQRMEEFFQQTAGQYEMIDRVLGWGYGWRMAKSFLFCGAGFGAFRDVFPRYLPDGNTTRWSQMHNDYLEVLIEGGLVGAVLVAWLAMAYWRRVASPRALRFESGGVDLATLGLLVGLLTLTVHAGFDFNHQIPANALLFTTLAAIALSRAEGRLGAGGSEP